MGKVKIQKLTLFPKNSKIIFEGAKNGKQKILAGNVGIGSDFIGVITFPPVTFSNGNATKSWTGGEFVQVP
jgi:hypothetical protein